MKPVLALIALSLSTLSVAAEAHYVDFKAELHCTTQDGKKLVLNDLIVGGPGKALHSDARDKPLKVSFLGSKDRIATVSLDRDSLSVSRSAYLLHVDLDSGELTSREEWNAQVPYVYVSGKLETPGGLLGASTVVDVRCIQPLK